MKNFKCIPLKRRFLSKLLFFNLLAVLFAPDISTVLYASFLSNPANSMILLTSDRGLLISKDNGSIWQDFNSGLPEGAAPEKMLNSGNILYLLTRKSGIYRFSETGGRWISMNSKEFLVPGICSGENDHRKITAFAADIDDPGTFGLATKHSVFLKRNEGPWKKITVDPLEKYVTAIALCGKGKEIKIGTSYGGIFKRSNNKFINQSEGLPRERYSKDKYFVEEIAGFAYNTDPRKTLYAALNFGGGIFSSNDGGLSWVPLNLPDSLKYYLIYDFKYHNNNLFISSDAGIFSIDPAANTSLRINISTEIQNLSLKKTNLSVFIIKNKMDHPPLLYNLNQYEKKKNSNLKEYPKKAIYANIYTLKKNLDKYIKIIKQTGFNSLVIDMKDDWGSLCYNSKNSTAKEIGAVKFHVNIADILKELKKAGIYAIARIVVFKDKYLFDAYNNKYAVWDKKKNKPWKGNAREFWVDPHSEFVRDYNISIAEELQDTGFDEIQFDYIRFPSDGPLWQCQYRFKQSSDIYKSEILSCFLKAAKRNLSIPVSIDIYGFNAWYRFGNSIGQDAAEFAEIADIICPMVYPSHYGSEFFLKYQDHNRPYRIVRENIKRARILIGGNAAIRPYLQAFNLLSPAWGPEYINNQINGAVESGCDGYTFWNAKGDYEMLEKAVPRSGAGGNKK